MGEDLVLEHGGEFVIDVPLGCGWSAVCVHQLELEAVYMSGEAIPFSSQHIFYNEYSPGAIIYDVVSVIYGNGLRSSLQL